jgi:hypothetical protein
MYVGFASPCVKESRQSCQTRDALTLKEGRMGAIEIARQFFVCSAGFSLSDEATQFRARPEQAKARCGDMGDGPMHGHRLRSCCSIGGFPRLCRGKYRLFWDQNRMITRKAAEDSPRQAKEFVADGIGDGDGLLARNDVHGLSGQLPLPWKIGGPFQNKAARISRPENLHCVLGPRDI